MQSIELHFKKLGELFIEDKEEFIQLIPRCEQFSKSDINIIYKALYKAIELHSNSKPRKSGKPYITHPIAVASFLAQMGFGFEVVVAALLHDTIEDTDYTLEECEKDFGPVIAKLVNGVTKIGRDINDATHRKILRSVDNDVRCYAIKGTDRLHNMYTLPYLPPKKQVDIAIETMTFYMEIAKILGIYKLKDEFQDLCLFILNNDNFIKYENVREELKKKYNSSCLEFAQKVQSELSRYGIGMFFNFRVKNIGAIFEALNNEESIYDIDDLLALKMVLKSEEDCYRALEIVERIGVPILLSREDFIYNPKDNGYQSLNTNITYKDANIQVRIRTEQMQKTNDLGVFSDINMDVQSKVNDFMRKQLKLLVNK